jgi:GNAT superfamily N-acetyltransferase
MLSIRFAMEADVTVIHELICELAAYEKLSHEVVATETDLRRYLFGEPRYAEVLIAEVPEGVAGFALFFHNFSTFLGRPGVYLEDLYVRPAYRRRGIGRALFQRLAQVAVRRHCGRLEWAVLDWNTPAWEFYHALGALPMTEWTTHRLSGEALHRLATESRSPDTGLDARP